MSLRLSAIICAYNPQRAYLDETLDSIRAQVDLSPNDAWELLLIDNASAPALDTWVNLTGLPNARIIREDKLGLTHARLRSFSEALRNAGYGNHVQASAQGGQRRQTPGFPVSTEAGHIPGFSSRRAEEQVEKAISRPAAVAAELPGAELREHRVSDTDAKGQEQADNKAEE